VTGVVGSGALLGILSRLEERTPGLSAGVSSDAMWVAVAFAIGSSRQSARGGAAGGAVTLTAANLGYYGWILATESTDPAAVAGAPSLWLILGVAGGALFGAAGAIWRTGSPLVRTAAALLCSAVLIADGGPALRGAPASDAISVVAGVTLACASASTPLLRCLALAACALLVTVAATGTFEPLLP
jgi:Family of unknown function (DUF6518)